VEGLGLFSKEGWRGQSAIREFIRKILSIRTEFWNRGLQSDSLERAVPAEFREEVKRLLQKYKDAIALIAAHFPLRRIFACFAAFCSISLGFLLSGSFAAFCSNSLRSKRRGFAQSYTRFPDCQARL
jgi:hypothetical protein